MKGVVIPGVEDWLERCGICLSINAGIGGEKNPNTPTIIIKNRNIQKLEVEKKKLWLSF